MMRRRLDSLRASTALAALYFVVTGVQFWGTSYMLVALSAPTALVNTMFVCCAGTAPTMGVFFGGWFVDYIGGYIGSSQRVNVLKLCVIMGEGAVHMQHICDRHMWMSVQDP